MRESSANWKELQHTGVCLKNIHRSTKLLARTSLRPLRDSAIHSLALTPLNLEVYGLQIIMLLAALLFLLLLLLSCRLERRSSGGTESQSRAAGGAMERGSARSDSRGSARSDSRGSARSDSRGSGGSVHPSIVPYIIRRATIHYIHTIRIRNIARIYIRWGA